MATTTNFGWTTPNDTDLVKDGASAIRTLGSAIDTSFVDLKGGTTGQILSKASNTDLDYTWVTTDDANAIQNAIVDAKGDLIAATANDTPARLAVGNNGETLVADSSTSTGLRYSPAPAVGNPVLNSAFQCWQRGTSLTPGADSFTYLADRWMTYRSVANYTVSRQATGDTTNLPNIQYATRVQRTAGTTNTNEIYFTQTFETVNSIPYAGKTVTLSFYARKGADYSQASSAVVAQVQSGTGTDQNIVGGFTGASAFISQSATLTTTWQRFSYTGTAAATTTQLGLAFRFTAVGTAGAADYFEVTGVQLDLGSVALPFRTYAGTIQGELAACQRYYEKSYDLATAPATANTAAGLCMFSITSVAQSAKYGGVKFSVAKRVAPTVTIYGYGGGAGKVSTDSSGADQAANSGTASSIGQGSFVLGNTSGSTVTTSGGTACHFVAEAEL